MFHQLLEFCREEKGVTAVEYAVLLALILVAVIMAINAVGSTNSGIWASDSDKITSAMSGS